ncbi:hypothetical protein R1flu_010133 [Riccia fluitans]|uniref:Uncharacterized protein n=1 Tax=Riccia fluitans TaxID=41844 RepID=A0ABD1Z440_9MARC
MTIKGAWAYHFRVTRSLNRLSGQHGEQARKKNHSSTVAMHAKSCNGTVQEWQHRWRDKMDTGQAEEAMWLVVGGNLEQPMMVSTVDLRT